MKNRSIFSSVLLLVLLLFVVPSVTMANSGIVVESGALKIDIELTKWLTVEFNTGIHVSEVVELREKNIEYGDISMAYALAAESGSPVRKILDMRYEDKMGWGKIARQLGVKVSDAVHRASSVLNKSGLEQEGNRIKGYVDEKDDDKDAHPGHIKHKQK
jgi:hypothetical protein